MATAIAKKDIPTVEEALNTVDQQMRLAEAAGKFLVTISYIENGKTYTRVTTWDYPRGDYPNVMDTIREHLEGDNTPPLRELPRADLSNFPKFEEDV